MQYVVVCSNQGLEAAMVEWTATVFQTHFAHAQLYLITPQRRSPSVYNGKMTDVLCSAPHQSTLCVWQIM